MNKLFIYLFEQKESIVLYNSIHKNIDSLLIPKDKLEAYKIQASYETLSNSALFGWKIAATSVDGQKHIGVDGPLA